MSFRFPQIEEKILKFWEKNQIFKKSIRQRRGRPYFSFYDGPPFATGKPHYGHILATTIKDTVLRYWTMRGYQVPRRVGWDCHGLPIENLIEKELGIKNKREIEKMGIEKFNLACRNSVFRCVKDFEKTLKRVGRWADYKKAYATLDNDYIESVWWVLKKLWENNLVYKDYRVSPYCPRCGTPLSNFEVNLGYKEVKDPSLFIKFKIKDFEISNTYFLVWTTTPWTLPANVALAINPQAEYLLVKQNKENYLLAKERKEVLKGSYEVVKKVSGKKLLYLEYQPLFEASRKAKPPFIENAFKVLPASFVSLEEGTGIVHIASMYGQEDFELAKKFKLPFFHIVGNDGKFKKEVRRWANLFVKDADPEIIKNLAERDLLYKEEKILHTYPFCWRCDSPLLYYAIESWYIAVRKLKKQLIKNNKKIHWVPAHIKEGRFGKWLKEAKDWGFSRNRFWGAPIPIWQCENCQHYLCVGSLRELEKRAIKKYKLKDLHRPYIDKVMLRCPQCAQKMRRVPEVFDCWFESGSMPYAQWHYPFENKKLVENTFPADFIAEGLDQTRGWFYTLHVLAGALTLKDIGLGKNQPAFKNVIVNGLILDAQGRKLSKSLGNYTDPQEIFDQYGADSMRYFLLASTPIGQDYRFSSEGVKEVWRKVISTLLNCYFFFETYKEKDFKPKKNFRAKGLLNKWILSRLNNLNLSLVKWMDQYELTKASRLLEMFVDDLSNWYIRRSRQKFQKPFDLKEKEEYSQTLYHTLFVLSKLMAPFLPFLSEYLYQNLKTSKDPESIHLADYPKPKKKLINKKLEREMIKAREIVSQGLAERVRAKIKVRQPLRELVIPEKKLAKELIELIKEELNVKKISFGKKLKLDKKITKELKEEGAVREIIRHIQEMRKRANLKPVDGILVGYLTDSLWLKKVLEKYQSMICQEGKIKKIEPKKKEKYLLEKTIKINEKEITLAIKKT